VSSQSAKRVLVRVCTWRLRYEFNVGRFVERVNHDLRERVRRSPAPAALGEVPGTESHFITYQAQPGTVVAMAFCYQRPDGTLGGSGRIDPKWVLRGAEAWIPSHNDHNECLECSHWRALALQTYDNP